LDVNPIGQESRLGAAVLTHVVSPGVRELRTHMLPYARSRKRRASPAQATTILARTQLPGPIMLRLRISYTASAIIDAAEGFKVILQIGGALPMNDDARAKLASMTADALILPP
jgi:hypothetical protein